MPQASQGLSSGLFARWSHGLRPCLSRPPSQQHAQQHACFVRLQAGEPRPAHLQSCAVASSFKGAALRIWLLKQSHSGKSAACGCMDLKQGVSQRRSICSMPELKESRWAGQWGQPGTASCALWPQIVHMTKVFTICQSFLIGRPVLATTKLCATSSPFLRGQVPS